MPAADRERGRRRAATGRRRGGARTAPYRFLERHDGVRVEHPRHPAVDLRVDGRWIVITSATRRTRCPLFTASVGLARMVASAVLGRPSARSDEDFDAVRREIWALREPLQRARRRLLDRHAADYSAVEQRMLAIRGTVPRLARSRLFYRTPHLARDVRRFRAAAIALAFLEDELWPRALAARGRPPRLVDLYRLMRAWRGLFAPGGVTYRSLDRVLMNLPDGIYPALVCALRHVRLERPVTDVVELHLLLECVALAHQRGQRLPWLHALQHARAAAIRAGLARIAAATHRPALDPADPSDLRFVASYLLDAQSGAAERFEHVVGQAIRRHAEVCRRPAPADRGAGAAAPSRLGRAGWRPALDLDAPTASPPLPPPDVAGLRFLATVGEVVDEGRRMQHCIGVYAARALRGDCFLFHAEHDGASASIEVGAEGRVRQAAGPENRRNAACDWAQRELGRWIAGWPAGARRPIAAREAVVDAEWQQIRAEIAALRQRYLDGRQELQALIERIRQEWPGLLPP